MRRLVLIFALLLAACDEPPPPVQRPPPTPTAELRTVVSLRANQETLLAAGAGGRVYFSQPYESPDVRFLGSDAQVRPTALTSANIAKLLGQPAGDARVRAIAPLPGGDLIAYFGGTSRSQSLAALVRYRAADDTVALLAPSGDLATASGLGRTIDLAEPQLARAGDFVWLWLRTFDQSVFLRIDVRLLAGGAFRLAKPFGELTTGTGTFRFASDVLTGDAGGTLHLLRPGTRDLWTISETGRAERVETDPDGPVRTVAPLLYREAATARRATRLSFLPYAELSLDGAPGRVQAGPRYPALRLSDDAGETILSRDALRPRAAFPLHALRLTRWIVEPNSGDVIAYDAMSGEILRIAFSGV